MAQSCYFFGLPFPPPLLLVSREVTLTALLVGDMLPAAS
jgi:hypothetical protein